MSNDLEKFNPPTTALDTPRPAARAVGIGIEATLAKYDSAQKFAAVLVKSDFVPKSLGTRIENVAIALLFGDRLGLDPLTSMNGIAVINGRPSLWGDVALAVVRAHPDFEDIEEHVEQAAGDEKAIAVCTIKRRGQTPCVRKFSWADAVRAKLDQKDTYKQHPKRMIAMRARAHAMRDAFADALQGLYIGEEAQDIPPEPRNVTPVELLAAAPEGQRVSLRKPPPAPQEQAATASETAPATETAPPAPVEQQAAPAAKRGPTGQEVHKYGRGVLGLDERTERRAIESVTGKSSAASVNESNWPAVKAAMEAAASSAAKAKAAAPATAPAQDDDGPPPGVDDNLRDYDGGGRE